MVISDLTLLNLVRVKLCKVFHYEQVTFINRKNKSQCEIIMLVFSLQTSAVENENYVAIIDGINSVSRFGRLPLLSLLLPLPLWCIF